MRAFRRALVSRWLPISLAAFAALSLWTSVVSSGVVRIVSIAAEWRPLAYDISVGYLVSYMFFLLVVALPGAVRRRRMAGWLAVHYRGFKLACIQIYLRAIGDSWDSDLPEQLLDPHAFREYFSAWYSSDQTRWHAVHNGLYDYGIPRLVMECELFGREIEFTLIKLEVPSDEVVLFLKHLTRQLMRLKISEPDCDDVKHLLNFLYPVHSHWSWIEGYVGRDPVANMIRKL